MSFLIWMSRLRVPNHGPRLSAARFSVCEMVRLNTRRYHSFQFTALLTSASYHVYRGAAGVKEIKNPNIRGNKDNSLEFSERGKPHTIKKTLALFCLPQPFASQPVGGGSRYMELCPPTTPRTGDRCINAQQFRQIELMRRNIVPAGL